MSANSGKLGVITPECQLLAKFVPINIGRQTEARMLMESCLTNANYHCSNSPLQAINHFIASTIHSL